MINYKSILLAILCFLLLPLSLAAQEVQYLLPLDNNFTQISNFSESLARVEVGYDSVRFIDTQGVFAFRATFEDAGNFHSGRTWVMKKINDEEKYGYINKTGKLVVPYIYDKTINFSCNRAAVKQAGEWKIINKKGDVVIGGDVLYINRKDHKLSGSTYSEDKKPSSFHSNRMLVKRNGKFGYINLSGEVIIPFQYSIAENFSEGVAVVKVKRPGKPQPYQWQAIDTTGKVLFTFKEERYPVFNEGFSNGLLPFKDYSGSSRKYGFINKQGEVVIGPGSYRTQPFSFSDGVCIIQFSGQRSDNKDGYMRVVDTLGKVISKIPFTNEFGVMYDSNHKFHEGLLAVKIQVENQGMKWGYVDKQGDFVIPPQYYLALDFHDGYAIVKTSNGRVNYIKNPLIQRGKYPFKPQ